MMGAGSCLQAPVAEGGPAALEGTLSPLPTLEDSLPPLLGLRPATRRKYPPGPPSKIGVLRREPRAASCTRLNHIFKDASLPSHEINLKKLKNFEI